MFHFPVRTNRRKGKRRLEGSGSGGGREEVNEQYVSVERAEGGEGESKASGEASGLMWAFF